MTGIAWTTWIWWLGGGLLLIISLTLLLWALFWDRARGRKRCPRCWYDMSAAPAPGMTCSECGKTVKRPRKLLKTRRRKRWALVALLGIAASGYLAVQPRVRDRGWWSLVPTKVLIAGLPLASDADDFWCSELARRVQSGTGFFTQRWGVPKPGQRDQMTQEEYALFFDASVRGDWRARPVSTSWQRKYGDLLEAWLQRNTQFTLAQGVGGAAEEHRLRTLPMSLDFETRDPWPIDAKPFAKARFGCWWPRNTRRRARLLPRDEGLSPMHVMPTHPASLEIPDFSEAERTFVFDVVYEKQFQGSNTSDWVEIGREETTLVIRRAGTTEDALKPLDEATSASLTGALQSSAMKEIMIRNGQWVGSTFNVQECRAPQHEGIAFGFAVDLILDGEVYLTSYHSIRGGVRYDFSGGRMEGDVDRFRERLRDRSGEWQARFRSDVATALRVFDADRYWVGEFTIPLMVDRGDTGLR